MLKIIRFNLMDLPTKLSMTYFWCVGFMISAFMMIQVFSGMVLSLFYDVLGKFSMLMMWTDDNIYCWIIRYIHMWCVSIMFFLVYVHIGRSLYYSSYRMMGVWKVGFFIYVILMVEAFLGYILPWHQMSYWAATVLTSIMLSVPVVGGLMFSYVVGGFSVTLIDTLVRVFPVHMSLGFILLGLMVLHLFYLHQSGSTSPLFFYKGYSDCVYFHSYHTIKDLFAFMVVMVFSNFLVLVDPKIMLDVEAFIVANPLVTPDSMKPEWYFLLFYAMLRSMNSKVGGLVLVMLFLLVLWFPSKNFSSIYVFSRQVCFWLVVSLFVALSYLGGCHAEYPYMDVSKVCSLMMLSILFIYKFFWIIPLKMDSRLLISCSSM